MLTPAQYEQRCREMLQRNARTMSAEEIERMAYGANDGTLAHVAYELDLAEAALYAEDDDA